ITYSSRTFLISEGLGSLSRARSARSSSSSRMMSLQSSTHSSQTKTDGPAISLRTSCWLLPQKEQYNNLPSSCRPRVSSVIVAPYGAVPGPSPTALGFLYHGSFAKPKGATSGTRCLYGICPELRVASQLPGKTRSGREFLRRCGGRRGD